MTGGKARARYLRIRRPWGAADRSSFAMIRDRITACSPVVLAPDRLLTRIELHEYGRAMGSLPIPDEHYLIRRPKERTPMGLDITAYSRLKPVGQHTSLDSWCEDESHVTAFIYSDFPASFRGVTVTGTDDQFTYGGCYAVTDGTETHGFRAGSYGGYNQWREDLRRQFNPSNDPGKPFYELIWFADNEGTIGPKAAADLLADFRQHASTYEHRDDPIGWYRKSYDDWTRACKLAADGGLIEFH